MDYKSLKDLIKHSVEELERDETSRLSFSPRTTSLTIQRPDRGNKNSEEVFFERLEKEACFHQFPLFAKPNTTHSMKTRQLTAD